MSEVIDLVREDDVQNERTAGMIRAVNDNHHRKARAEEQDRMAGRARIQELEAQRQARVRELQKLAWMAFGWAAGCTALVILAHTGAIAGWLMQAGTTALSFALGLVCGRLAKEG